MLRGIWDRLVGRGRDRTAAHEAEREQMSPAERHLAGESIEDFQADEFVGEHPHVSVELGSDVNHFTLVIGGGHGPLRVAATLAALALGDAR